MAFDLLPFPFIPCVRVASATRVCVYILCASVRPNAGGQLWRAGLSSSKASLLLMKPFIFRALLQRSGEAAGGN